MGDSEIAKLCRQIYQKHKRALDIIHEHRPDPKAERGTFLTELIDNTEIVIYKGRHKNDLLFFRPQEWDDVPVFNAGNAIYGFFRFVFHNQPNNLILFLETSPGDERVRRRLFEMGQKDESLFNDLVDPGTGGYPKLYRRTFLTPRFCEEAADSDQEKEIHKQWAEFIQEDLPRIDSTLKKEQWIWGSDET